MYENLAFLIIFFDFDKIEGEQNTCLSESMNADGSVR